MLRRRVGAPSSTTITTAIGSAESITDGPVGGKTRGGRSVFPRQRVYVDAVLPSPNHGERRGFRRPEYVILHYTGMPSSEAAIALLRDPEAEVSSHYVVEEAGRVMQLVPEARRAWHAGSIELAGVRDMNSASIGMEICNAGHDGGLPAYPDAQIQSVGALPRHCESTCGPAGAISRAFGYRAFPQARSRRKFPVARTGASGRGPLGRGGTACSPRRRIFAGKRDPTCELCRPARPLRLRPGCERRLRSRHRSRRRGVSAAFSARRRSTASRMRARSTSCEALLPELPSARLSI